MEYEMRTLILLATLIVTSNVFAQGVLFDPHFDQKAKLEKIVFADNKGKCSDGSEVRRKSLGNLNESYSSLYIAKSNSGEYITLTPRAEGGSHVELFYCPLRINAWENGKQVTRFAEISNYNFRFGNMVEKRNCDYSDMSGIVDIRFEGQYRPNTIQFRPIVGSDREKSLYSKFCSETIRRSSSKIPDQKITIQ